MGRIADKHGLTNPYREFGHKRLVKRGRKRKYLLGRSTRKRRASYTRMKRTTTSQQIVQQKTSNQEYIKTYEDIEKIVKVCPNCRSRYIEKIGNVLVCQNCRASYKAIDDLVDEKILSVFEQNKKESKKKTWWHFWK